MKYFSLSFFSFPPIFCESRSPQQQSAARMPIWVSTGSIPPFPFHGAVPSSASPAITAFLIEATRKPPRQRGWLRKMGSNKKQQQQTHDWNVPLPPKKDGSLRVVVVVASLWGFQSKWEKKNKISKKRGEEGGKKKISFMQKQKWKWAKGDNFFFFFWIWAANLLREHKAINPFCPPSPQKKKKIT